MALTRKNIEEIPKDAIRLTQDEALAYQWKIITEWDNFKDVWALKHTSSIIATFSAVTGIYVNSHYRNKLKLGNYGRLSSYLPIVVIPAMFSMLAHKFFVQRSVLLQPMAECPLCVQLRAATFQVGLGVMYPTILAPLAGFMFATRHYTYMLPNPTQNPMEVLQLWRRLTKPIVPILGTVMVGQAVVTMYLTYKEMEQNFKLQLKLKKMEDTLEQEKSSYFE